MSDFWALHEVQALFGRPDEESREKKDLALIFFKGKYRVHENTIMQKLAEEWRHVRRSCQLRRRPSSLPSEGNRKTAIPHDDVLYQQRRKIENMFGRLKDWRRIHTRYDRCAHTYFSAICIAAAAIFWL